jgi:hypothetical protein
MREHGLLSPHRARTRSDAPHDRRIVTEAPNVMWATDAIDLGFADPSRQLKHLPVSVDARQSAS